MTIVGAIESILFVASKPLSFVELGKALRVDKDKIIDAIDTLKMKYNHEENGIHVLVVEETVAMGTNPRHANVIDGFIRHEAAGDLTKAQLETLTVIAYRGPMTRPELEQIRGVNCSIILRNLLIRGLIVEAEDDHALLPGYQLSIQALAHLGIVSPQQLPEYDKLRIHEHLDQVLEDA